MKWEVDERGSYENVWIVESAPRQGCIRPRSICKVISPSLAFHEPTDAGLEEMLSTARIIASAPDLLEACKAARGAVDGSRILTASEQLKVEEQIEKAISKAEAV